MVSKSMVLDNLIRMMEKCLETFSVKMIRVPARRRRRRRRKKRKRKEEKLVMTMKVLKERVMRIEFLDHLASTYTCH